MLRLRPSAILVLPHGQRRIPTSALHKVPRDREIQGDRCPTLHAMIPMYCSYCTWVQEPPVVTSCHLSAISEDIPNLGNSTEDNVNTDSDYYVHPRATEHQTTIRLRAFSKFNSSRFAWITLYLHAFGQADELTRARVGPHSAKTPRLQVPSIATTDDDVTLSDRPRQRSRRERR